MVKGKLSTMRMEDIRPYPNNPRRNDGAVDAVAESIRQCGYVAPIIVDEDGVILAGHTRYKALKKLGYETADVLVKYGMTEEQKKKYRLLDNKTNELADWDYDLLADELAELDLSDFDFDFGIEYDEEETDVVEDSLKTEVVQDKEPDIDENTETIVKFGDIWQLGRHRLMCGDSTSQKMFSELMGGNTARLCVTSPPYGVGMEYEEKGIEPWRKTISGVIETITKHCRIICWNIGDLFATESQFIEPTSMYSTEYMKQNGFDIMYSRIWKKQGANFNGVNPYHLVSMKPVQEYEWILGYGKKDYEKDYEPIQKHMKDEFDKSGISKDTLSEITGAKHMYRHWFTPHQWVMIDEANYNKIQKYCEKEKINAFREKYSVVRRRYDDLNIYQKTLTDEERSTWGQWAIWEIPTVHTRDGHPAAFPVELPARLIKMHTREGDNVIEPFCGSGTTIIACEQLNRTCFGMEFDPKYCDVIIKRWETLTGEKAVLLNDDR